MKSFSISNFVEVLLRFLSFIVKSEPSAWKDITKRGPENKGNIRNLSTVSDNSPDYPTNASTLRPLEFNASHKQVWTHS